MNLNLQHPGTRGLDKAGAINCYTASNLNTCYCHCYIFAPVAVAAEMEAGKDSQVSTKVHASGPWGPNLDVVLCVTDELLVHHWRAAFLSMMRIMRSPFPSSTSHMPTCQNDSEAEQAMLTVKWRTES